MSIVQPPCCQASITQRPVKRRRKSDNISSRFLGAMKRPQPGKLTSSTAEQTQHMLHPPATWDRARRWLRSRRTAVHPPCMLPEWQVPQTAIYMVDGRQYVV